MPKKITAGAPESRPTWEALETHIRAYVQVGMQRLLEEEVTEFLGRAKLERRAPDAETVYRNGYGKLRRLTLSSGTIEVRRPRVRGMEERLEGRFFRCSSGGPKK